MIGLQANVFISVTNQSDFSLFLYSTYKHLFVIKKKGLYRLRKDQSL